MSQDKDDFFKYAEYHNISDFSDLSVAEIIALEFLVRYDEPVVRHMLYTEVKQFIESKEEVPEDRKFKAKDEYSRRFLNVINTEKRYHTSSFYNSLNNLEQKGLLKINNKEKGKKATIEPTPYTKYVPKLLLKFLINNNVMDYPEYRRDFINEFLEVLEGRNFEEVLTVWFSEYEVLSIVQMLLKFMDKVYILSKSQSNRENSRLGDKNVEYIEMTKERQIKMPENFFDGAILPVYKKNPKFFGLSRKEILEEVKRVCKPNAYIILIAIDNMKYTENYFMNDLIQMYNLALNNRIFTEDELFSDMKNVNLNDIKIFQFHGLLIGRGINS
ncbi:MAG: hypothetical protein ACTSVV_02425 [Promethearchaeota archaeon]